MTETDTDEFWLTAGAAGMRLRMRALEMADRLGDGATPEQVAEAMMAQTDDAEARRACCSLALDLARLELRERTMPPGHELTDNELATVEDTRRRILHSRAESCGAC